MEKIMTKVVEYRVRPVTRWIITRFKSETRGDAGSCGSEVLGEFDHEPAALRVKEILELHDTDVEKPTQTAQQATETLRARYHGETA